MDKNAIKKYAVWARRELISRVSQRAALYEITDKGYGDASADSVLGRVMSAEEKRQRQALIAQIREKGYEQVMEEIAYTWFNRFIALRFMEVNGYLPSRVRVFTDDENKFKPQILTEAINMELDGLDMEKVYALKNANDDDALFKYMIIVQCNALSSILPGMFQRISDYTELLFPDNLLREGSVIEQMVAMIPEEDWTDQVQIIGWLYQYYNTEPKDKVFADLKKNIKISKENIPAATQLFTPDWIVRYMVENSLGRLWLEGHPNDELKATWKYYLDEAEQEPDVQEQLAEIRKEYASLRPEDILAIDPCQGSGHILAYMFDVLVQIYESYGYTAREAAANIVEHNIWGLDIDDRATQLAYFSVMMKARQYDRRFLSRGIQPHVYSIVDSKNISPQCIEFFANGNEQLKSNISTIINELSDAKELGSIICGKEVDYDLLYRRIEEIQEDTNPSIYSYETIQTILPLIDIAQALSQTYHVVITNPPYMSSKGMSVKLASFVQKEYPISKADLFSVFIERCSAMTREQGYQAMITQHAWMFLSSFEKLRNKLMQNDTINMVHLGARAFEEIGGEVVQTTSFVFRHSKIHGYKGTYCRLVAPTTQVGKEVMFLSGANRYITKQDNFYKVPGITVAYWASNTILDSFNDDISAGKFADFRHGMSTSDNNKYLRLWFEPSIDNIGFNCENKDQTTLHKWYVYLKGGSFRRWYGNFDYVVNWKDDGKEIKDVSNIKYPYLKGNLDFVLGGQMYFFKPGYTWSSLTTGKLGIRKFGTGCIFDAKGQCFFPYDKKYGDILLAFYNSAVFEKYGEILSPTLDFNSGVISKAPILFDEQYLERITALVAENVAIARTDWDSFETSWDFSTHPIIAARGKVSPGSTDVRIEDCFSCWQQECLERVNHLKENEEELNRIFISMYGLESEVTPAVEEKDVSARKANLIRDIKSLISFAVGCMFGRYSLDRNGVICAGADFSADEYFSYKPDSDGIIPICDDEYFQDDIVGRFVSFTEIAFGKQYLEENLQYIAACLGSNGNSRDILRNYFINEFYNDHCATYSITGSGKRPIYWLFDSGKKNGFKCLIYMHRYQPDTIARIRTDYVHEQQSRYRTAIADLESRIANAGTGERVKLSKQLVKLQDQAEELRVYEEKIHHLADQMIRIDLDDGVKHNYAIFQDVLAKIK